MKKVYTLLVLGMASLAFMYNTANHQENTNPIFYNWNEALENPEAVTHLNLAYSNWDEIPKEIGQFKQLKTLDLSNNSWKTLPDEFTKLEQLESLKLKNIKDIKPLNVFSTLSQIKTLESLDLEGSILVFLPEVSQELKTLKSLNLKSTYLEEIPKNIVQLQQLEYLNLADNNFTRLPYQFSFLKVKHLNLSYNKLKVKSTFEVLQGMKNLETLEWQGLSRVSKRIGKLAQIEHLDLSYGEFKNLPKTISGLNNLKQLSMNYCQRLDLDNNLEKLQACSNLKELNIYQNGLALMPASLNTLTQLQVLTMGGDTLEQFASISNLKALRTLSITHSPNLKIAAVLPKITRLDSLTQLSLQNCNITKLSSSIAKLSDLVYLDLSGNVLSSLPKEIQKLSNLKTLKLQGNPFSEKTIAQLKIWLPNCTIDFVLPSPIKFQRKIQPPIPMAIIPVKKYTVDANQASIVTTETGTNIDIPKDAFLDKNGQVVTGKVEIEYREFNNPLDIYLSGIPMQVKADNGQIEQLESAGMVEFRANKNGEELQANPEALVNIELTTNQKDTNYDLYYFEENKGVGEWKKDKTLKDEVVSVEDATPQKIPSSVNLSNYYPAKPLKVLLKKHLIHARYYPNDSDLQRKSKSKRKRMLAEKRTGLNFVLSSKHQKSSGTNRNRYSYVDTKVFSDLMSHKPTPWKYEGEDKDSIQQIISWIKIQNNLKEDDEEMRVEWETEWEAKTGWTYTEALRRQIIDFQVKPNFKKDCYDLQFISLVDTIVIPVFPVLPSSTDLLKAQKQNVKFFKAYMKSYQKRLEDWKKQDDLYAKALKAHEQQMAEYQEQMAEYIKNGGERRVDPSLVDKALSVTKARRKLPIRRFGKNNIDRYYKYPTERLLAEAIDEEGKQAKLISVVVLDERINAPISFTGGSFEYVKNGRHGLILINDYHEIAIVSKSAFRKASKKNGILKVKVEWMPMDKGTNRKKLSQQMAAL